MSAIPRIASALLVAALCGTGRAQIVGQPPPPRLLNLSSLAIGGGPGTGPGAFAASFLIEGPTAQAVLIRVVGPTLTQFQVSGLLLDPALSLYDGKGALVATNDNWGGSSALSSAFAAVGAFSLGPTSLDAALLQTLNPAVYTAVVSGAGAASGTLLLEIYEVDAPASPSRIPYFALRGNIIGGLRAGFVVGPSNATTNTSFLFRGSGPALGAVGVPGVMSDPTLGVLVNSAALGANDNWTATTTNATTTAGLRPFASGSTDAALLLTLPPAAYTVDMSHLVGTNGIAMLEIAQIDAGRATFAPALLVPPFPVSAMAGGNVTLSAVAIGRPPPTYQWRRNGVNLAGQSNPALSLANVQPAQAGNYSVLLSNAAGNTTSTDWVLTVAPPPGPPTILTQPTAWTVPAGATVTFEVQVSGAGPLTYQWLRNGAPVQGATNGSLSIPNVQNANAGSYAVQVANPQGTVTSSSVALTIALPPSITTQPVSRTVSAGSAVAFSVVASGAAPLTYQWGRNGILLPGATNATLTIASAQPTDAGTYACVVTNVAGSVTSAPATLVVEPTYAGTYFGTFGGSAGSWALVVRPDGIGSFVGFLASPRAGLLATVRVGADGRFRNSGTLLQPQPTPTPPPEPPFTLAGAIDNAGRVTGSLEGLGRTLSGDREGSGGETAAFSGIYQATGSDGGITIVVVGRSRQVMVLRYVPGPVAANATTRPRPPGVPPVAANTLGVSSVTGGTGMMDNAGSFTVTTENNVTIVGRVDAAGSTVSGNVVSPNAPLVLIFGSETDGVGPPVVFIAPLTLNVSANASARLSVVAGGKTPLTFQWLKNGVAVQGATSDTFTLASAQPGDAGQYACQVTNNEGNAMSDAVPLTVGGAGPAARFSNLSILTQLSSADDSFVLGYVVVGDSLAPGKPLVIRAAGPSLQRFGMANPTVDPKLEIFAGANKRGENDNWGGSPDLAAAMARVGAFEFADPTSKDAALVTEVSTSDNSVIVSATGPGQVIAEVYEVASAGPVARRIVNFSVLKPIGAGFTAGFVIDGAGSKRVLVRAVGPTLRTQFNTPDAIDDPQLVLRGADGLTRANDNWGGTGELTAAFRGASAFDLPAASLDAALIATLAAGNYTVEVTAAGNATGPCLIEIYDLDQ